MNKLKGLHRFDYHYNKEKHCMTVNFNGTTIDVKKLVCLYPCWTKWSDEHPTLKMVGVANKISITGDTATIE